MFSSRKNAKQYLLLCLLAASCTLNKNSLKISSVNFTDEIETQQNLVFTFNHALVNDSFINRWDSSAFIKFSPPVKGLFKWNTTKELVFSPSSGFQPSTDYKGEFTDAILTGAGKNFNMDEIDPACLSYNLSEAYGN